MIEGMNTTPFSRPVAAGLLIGALALGYILAPAASAAPVGRQTAKAAETKQARIGKNVFLEIQGDKRRVVVNASVCLREGPLEQLLTRKGTKEHEAILAADVDARDIHTALILARAKPGSTVKFKKVNGKFTVIPPSGTRIKVSLRYQDKGKEVTIPAQRWVRVSKTGKDLAHDWVFAGSVLFRDPLDPKRPLLYGANDGDVICVANFDGALLDLPINSSKSNAELAFEAHTQRIPPVGTKVTIILEPVLAAKKK
jgi:hypothetical protein